MAKQSLEGRVKNMTLIEVLDELGYTTAPAPARHIGRKRILLNGVQVFSGTAGQVWDWLRAMDKKGSLPCSDPYF